MKKETSEKQYLDEKLIAYGRSDYYPFHMPGHKRNMHMESDPYTIDITEIEGFDNLHDAHGILKEAQGRAASIYGADKSYYLVNGSTCGILAAVSAAVGRGGKLLMARNCHEAVYHATYLRELKVSYLYPVITKAGIQGIITPESVETELKKDPAIQAVILTSPTFDGVVSDIAEIAKIVHAYQIPLLVDEAHGAHFGFHPYFPETAVRLGADLVIQSLHKTLPSLTQTALLHMRYDRVDRKKIRRFLDIYETSSPSYVLMAGMDRCIRMLEERSEEYFEEYVTKLKAFYCNTEKLKHVKVIYPEEFNKQEGCRFDPSKLIIRTEDSALNGRQLYEILLEQYHLQLEMCAGNYVLAMTSFLTEQEGYDRLLHALEEIDRRFSYSDMNQKQTNLSSFIARMYAPNQKFMEIGEAMEKNSVECPLLQATGQIAGDYVYLYPPGIPVLVPGERITPEVISNIQECMEMGLDIKGIHNLRINIVN